MVADAALDSDRVRVHLGAWIGYIIGVTEVGIAQGWRRSVHLFAALVKALTDEVEASAWGVGVNPPLAACALFQRTAGAASESGAESGLVSPQLVETVALVARTQGPAVFSSLFECVPTVAGRLESLWT